MPSSVITGFTVKEHVHTEIPRDKSIPSRCWIAQSRLASYGLRMSNWGRRSGWAECAMSVVRGLVELRLFQATR